MDQVVLPFTPQSTKSLKRPFEKVFWLPDRSTPCPFPLEKQAVVLTGVVPGYSGGSATVFHRFPSSRKALYVMMLAETEGLSIDYFPHLKEWMDQSFSGSGSIAPAPKTPVEEPKFLSRLIRGPPLSSPGTGWARSDFLGIKRSSMGPGSKA